MYSLHCVKNGTITLKKIISWVNFMMDKNAYFNLNYSAHFSLAIKMLH